MLTDGKLGLRLYDLTSQRQIEHFSHGSWTQVAAWSPTNDYVISSIEHPEYGAMLWDTSTGRQIRKYNGFKKRITLVAFDPQGHIVIGAENLSFYHPRTGEILRRTILKDNESAIAISFERTPRVAILSRGQPHYFTTSIQVRNPNTDHRVVTFAGPADCTGIISSYFLGDTDELMIVYTKGVLRLGGLAPSDEECRLRICNWKTGRLLHDVKTEESIHSVFPLDDSKRFIVGSYGPNPGCHILEIKTGPKGVHGTR